MSKANAELVPSIKVCINQLKNSDGEFDLDTLISYAEAAGYSFDVENAKKQEIARFCRSVISTYRDNDGDRTLLATGRSGEYIDRELCKNKDKLKAAIASMTEMRDGLNRTIRKTQRQVEGQLSFYSTPQAETMIGQM